MPGGAAAIAGLAGLAGADLDRDDRAVDAVAGRIGADDDVAVDLHDAARRDRGRELVEVADRQRRIVAAEQVDVAVHDAAVRGRAEHARRVPEVGAEQLQRGRGGDHLDVRRRVERVVGVDREQRLAGPGVGDEQAGDAVAQRAAQQLLDLPGGVLLGAERLLAAADHDVVAGPDLADPADRDAGVGAVVLRLLGGGGRLATGLAATLRPRRAGQAGRRRGQPGL